MIKAGYIVQRDAWGSGVWVNMHTPGKDAYVFIRTSQDKSVHVPTKESPSTPPYIRMRTPQGRFMPWTASQVDILSDDWSEFTCNMCARTDCDIVCKVMDLSEINGALYDHEGFMRMNKNRPERIERIMYRIAGIDEKIARSVQERSVKLFRCAEIERYVSLLGEGPSREHIGKIFTTDGYTTASESKKGIEEFLPFLGEGYVKFIIRVPKGRGTVCSTGREYEILLARKTQFKITDVRAADGHTDVHLDVVSGKEDSVKKRTERYDPYDTFRELEKIKEFIRTQDPKLKRSKVDWVARFYQRISR